MADCGEVRTTGAISSTRAVRIALGATIAAVVLLGFFAAPASTGGDKIHKRRKAIERRARRQIGAPYVYGGSSPGGFDCSGFTRWVFAGHGASLPHRAASQFELGAIGRFDRFWKRGRLHTGDLVFFKTTSARVGHAGIYVGGGKFIHSSSSRGVRIDSVWDGSYYGPRWVAATRVPALQKPKWR